MVRSTVAHVDLAALKTNYRAIEALLAARTPPSQRPPGIIAVVKANAYGHGARHVALALEEAGAATLACADIEEGVVLRRAGVKGRILVFGALSVSDLSGLFEFDLTPTCSTPGAGRALQAAAAALGRRLRYHLKIDTGLNRLGFRHDNVERTLPELFASPNLVLAAVCTHFATADDLAHPLFDEQRRRFDAVLARITAMGVPVPARHAANSAALLRDPRVWFETRPAGPPALWRRAAGVRRRAVAQARAVAPQPHRLRQARASRARAVGYGATFSPATPRVVATVPAGYADGLDTRLGGRGQVLVGGRRAPIVGAVSMDMLAVDVTGMPVNPGDEVVFLGEQGGERITVSEMALAIGTIPYEILCRIGTRIERVYDGAGR